MVIEILGCTFDEAERWLRQLVEEWATCVHSTLKHDIRSRLGAGLPNTGTEGEVGDANEWAITELGSLTADQNVVQPIPKTWNHFQQVVNDNKWWRFFKTTRSYKTGQGLQYRVVSVLLPDNNTFRDITMHRHTLEGSVFYDMADVDTGTIL